MTYIVQCPNFPLVDQHAADPDGQLTPGTNTDCGEACITALVHYIHGITALTTEDVRRDLLGTATGPTTPYQLSEYLANECNIPNTVYNPTTQNEYLYRGWFYLKDARPMIELRYWETIGSPYLHYCVLMEQTEATATVMDPWAVQFVTESYDTHWKMAEGHSTLIGIDRTKDN